VAFCTRICWRMPIPAWFIPFLPRLVPAAARFFCVLIGEVPSVVEARDVKSGQERQTVPVNLYFVWGFSGLGLEAFERLRSRSRRFDSGFFWGGAQLSSWLSDSLFR